MNLNDLLISFIPQLSLLSSAAAYQCTPGALDLKQVYQQVETIKKNHTKIEHLDIYGEQLSSIDVDNYQALYHQCLAPNLTPKYITQLSKPQLHTLYQSLYIMAFHTNDLTIINQLANITAIKIANGEKANNLNSG